MKNKPFQIDEKRIYNTSFIPPPLVVSLAIQNECIAPIGGITIFTGLPKNGKTFFVGATIASYFLKTDLFGIQLKLPKEKPILTYFDTESPLHSFYKSIKTIKNLSQGKFNESNFNAFRLRGLTNIENIDIIKNYCSNNPKCGCIVIDGLLDLVVDENSAIETKVIDTLLKEITNEYHINVIGVLHTNRGGNDTNGKLGSKMDKTADSTLLIKKDKEQSNVYVLTGSLLRYAKKDIEPISLQRIDEEIIHIASEKPFKERTYKDWTIDEHIYLVNSTIPSQGYEYNEIIEDIKASQGVGVSYAKQIIKIWIAHKLIAKNHHKKYIIFKK